MEFLLYFQTDVYTEKAFLLKGLPLMCTFASSCVSLTTIIAMLSIFSLAHHYHQYRIFTPQHHQHHHHPQCFATPHVIFSAQVSIYGAFDRHCRPPPYVSCTLLMHPVP